MLIRRAEERDLEQVTNLFNELDEYHRINVPNRFKTLEPKVRIDYFNECLASDMNYFLVAEKDNKILGFIDAVIKVIENHPVFLDKKYMRIENLMVDENHRRMGIAKQLFKAIEDISREMNLDHLEVGVMEFNDAKYFYEHIGYKYLTRQLIKVLN